jgi:hypothetical protein
VNELTRDTKGYDFICVVDDSCPQLRNYFETASKYDNAFHNEVSCFKCDSFEVPVVSFKNIKIASLC